MIMFLNEDEIDFEKYLKQTDHKQLVKKATVWADELIEDAINPPVDTSVMMPWSSTSESFSFRSGEVTVWAGLNGSGKSMMTSQVALGLVKQKQRVCIASFEMKPKVTLKRMVRQFSGKSLESTHYVQTPVQQKIDAITRFKAFANNYLYFYDQQGTVRPEIIIAMCKYCAEELGITHIVVDNLMKCVAGEDNYNGQKDFVDQLTSVARDYNIHIHLVHHIRKLTNDEIRPSKSDLRGSSSITDQVDNVLILWRNKKKEHELQRGDFSNQDASDAVLMCEKQRNGEHESWYDMWYHKDSQQFLDRNGGMPMAFDNAGDF
jgi:twinkle protein